MARGNKARRDAFVDIPAEAKELLRQLHAALQRMPKIERMDGAGAEMKHAAYSILREYHMAYYCPEYKAEHIRQMIGWYGHLQAALEICCLEGAMPDRFKLPIAMRMERIEEGIMKWKNAQSAQRQAQAQCPPSPEDGARPVSDYE